MTRWLVGKYHAARTLHRFNRHFVNWRDVWAAYRAGKPVPPLVFRRGLTLHHGPEDDPVALYREVVVEGCYTAGLYEPKAGDTVIDLGANIGTFAVYLNLLARGVRVHSYEPMPATRTRLETNVRENGLATVTVYPEAVSDKAGTVTLYLGDGPAQNSLSEAAAAGGKSLTVPTVDLNEIVRRCGADIDLLKIDVEGAEIEALTGATPETLAKVKRAAVEFHDAFRPGTKATSERVLTAAGFTVTTASQTPDGGYGVIHARRT